MSCDPEGRPRTTNRALSGHQSLENVFLRCKTRLNLHWILKEVFRIRIEWLTGERDRHVMFEVQT